MFSLGNGTVADGPRVKLLIYHHWGNVQSRRNFSIRGLTINVCVWPPQSLTQHETFKQNRYTLFSIDGLKILFNNNDVQMMSFYLVSPLVGISNGRLWSWTLLRLESIWCFSTKSFAFTPQFLSLFWAHDYWFLWINDSIPKIFYEVIYVPGSYFLWGKCK